MDHTLSLAFLDDTAAIAPTPVARNGGAVHTRLTREQMLRAFMQRDPAAEGIFFAGVTTTGIYCRPTCRARKPQPGNIDFYPSAAAAEQQGFRPCKLCRPELISPAAPPLVSRLTALMSQDTKARITDKELAASGIDPSTARRQFQRYFGVSFQAYQRSQRLGMAFAGLRRGGLVADAQAHQGFESASGFRTAFAKKFGAAPSGADKTDCLWTRHLETPLGTMLAVASDQGLHVLDFADRRGLKRRLLVLQHKLHSTLIPGPHPVLDNAARQVANYFAGEKLALDLPFALAGSPWEKAVWDHLQTIPPGETRTYGEVAAALGRPLARRAVGRANGSNYLEIAIPCHRVIRSDGSPCGYGGGLWRKQWLLAHERRHAASPAAAKNAVG